MKKWKQYAAILLALVMCLGLAACGGDDEDTIPDTIKNLALNASVEYDYSHFMGTWMGENDIVLVMERFDEYYNSERFELHDADNKLLASGSLQYVEEYGFVYAYNEQDCIAHICWINDDGSLYIDSFGSFTKVSGDAPGDVVGDADDFTVLVGTWNLYGDEDATTVIDFTDGGWTLWELDSDGSWCLIDGGSLRAMGDGAYEAFSEYYDVTYDMYLLEDNEMMWDGTYFAKSE